MFQPSAQRTRFPEKLRGYARRAFESCQPEAWAEVEIELKKIIIEAFNDQVVWSLDWDRVPLPQERWATKARDSFVSVPDPDAKGP